MRQLRGGHLFRAIRVIALVVAVLLIACDCASVEAAGGRFGSSSAQAYTFWSNSSATGRFIGRNDPTNTSKLDSLGINTAGRQVKRASIDVQFTGQANSHFNPPDPNVAVGPGDLVQEINTQWAAYSKTGSLLSSTTLQSWYGFPATMQMVDPRVIYDPLQKRYVMSVTRFDAAGTGYADISVSTTSSATGSWCQYEFNVSDGNNEPDFPGLGYDVHALYYSINMYAGPGASGPYQGPNLIILNKTQMYACQKSVTTFTFHQLRNVNGTLAYAVQPAQTTDSEPAEYLANAFQGGAKFLTLWTLTSPLGNPQLSRVAVTVNHAYAIGPGAPQRGSSALIDTGDVSLLQAVVHSGTLWTAHTVATGTKNQNDSIQWFALNTSNHTVSQEQVYGISGSDVYYPAITVTPGGAAFLVFDQSNSSSYVQVDYAARRATDPLNQLESAIVLQTGQGPCCQSSKLQHWGDFFSAVVDPGDTTKVWLCGEYAAFQSAYGTTIAEVGF